ncbi:Glycosyl transferase, family 4 [Syntrophomonas zehnderi OL-4]|uniref:Glycosyl transferase, family 4 n=1 Tax=Syntrophomonas zehnderi OL-4 TaxID=690567 RepID=A0A0E4GAJ5_9FIRM|nr:hypothetical protein [Syntrophomonas zehnderi]CFX50510.1 Glycosyl transferase, family 4 [Syntrophomonas zehnderi OL-4]
MHDWVGIGLALLGGAVAEGLLLFFLLPMLQEVGAVRSNYLNQEIPVSAGLSFPLAYMLVGLIFALLNPNPPDNLLLLGLVTISFLGFIDDMLGQRDTLGFKGHFGALFKGRLTTGGLKAIGGGTISLFLAVFIGGGWLNIVINTLIMAFSTNMMNLLDLRPGRAVKGFLIFLVAISVIAWGRIDYFKLAPLLGAVLFYFPTDLKAQAMMGDAGSNVLGLALGFLAATSLSWNARLGCLIFLIAIHIYTEKYSLTTTIENSVVLRSIDQLGRGKNNG